MIRTGMQKKKKIAVIGRSTILLCAEAVFKATADFAPRIEPGLSVMVILYILMLKTSQELFTVISVL